MHHVNSPTAQPKSTWLVYLDNFELENLHHQQISSSTENNYLNNTLVQSVTESYFPEQAGW